MSSPRDSTSACEYGITGWSSAAPRNSIESASTAKGKRLTIDGR